MGLFGGFKMLTASSGVVEWWEDEDGGRTPEFLLANVFRRVTVPANCRWEAMVRSVVSPRKWVKETVIESILGFERCRFSSSCPSAFSSPSASRGFGFEDEQVAGLELLQMAAERTKNVLILMSDTGGGHRASAEAIKDAFRLEFGDKYRVNLSLSIVARGHEVFIWSVNDVRTDSFMCFW